MAYLRRDGRTGHWSVGFRFRAQEFHRSCRTNRKSIALRIQATVEETVDMLVTGRLEIPDGVDVGCWILSGGKATGRRPEKKVSEPRFGELCDSYYEDQRQKADTTRYLEGIHIKHLKRILRVSARISSIKLDHLKRYADIRLREEYRGKPTSTVTVRKELVTFRQIWAWAQRNKHVEVSCPLLSSEGRWALDLPKPVEPMKFQTWQQIERRIARGGLCDAEANELWTGLYLDETQVIELLSFVKELALHPFIYPMFAFTAYTGARRSEVVRAEIDDVDLDANQIMVRERKRRKHLSASTRFVPLHPQLRSVLQDWLATHPGGTHLFVRPNAIPKGRRQVTPEKLTPNQATHHFKQTLRDSEHDVVAGFHVLRHSFGSNLIRSGRVPSHVVARWMGHTSEEMKQLYQHLFPQDGVEQISVLQC